MTVTTIDTKKVQDDDDLAALAASGLSGESAGQDPLVEGGEEGAKVTFIGVAYNDIEGSLKLGDKISFVVAGEVTDVGDRKMKDGHVRHYAKVSTESVRIHEA